MAREYNFDLLNKMIARNTIQLYTELSWNLLIRKQLLCEFVGPGIRTNITARIVISNEYGYDMKTSSRSNTSRPANSIFPWSVISIVIETHVYSTYVHNNRSYWDFPFTYSQVADRLRPLDDLYDENITSLAVVHRVTALQQNGDTL